MGGSNPKEGVTSVQSWGCILVLGRMFSTYKAPVLCPAPDKVSEMGRWLTWQSTCDVFNMMI